ncbi:hypothetical protein SAMN05428642_101544 [Flaviramulus basaltis]|uniref:DUF4271 domain-containing protein n=1 Tax=Flaviramulus basaltis TaxID=369401 RepID=A0A1K2IBG8_9FLAO|nr:hypothetical protein [Flaviramulus basaltis]SFZ89757.1 hypothetical protein SAMN05428642_101544 [Flaviramulus basaltis]
MTTFDILFFHFFQYYKNKKSKKANSIATFYITVLQCSLLLLLGVFFAKFFRQMHMDTMSASKAWTLFVLIVIFIYFKNWMQYGGRKRKVLNAKMIKNRKLTYNIWLLWFLPVVILGLTFVLFQAV